MVTEEPMNLVALDYWIALDCWEAMETLEAQTKTPTASAVQHLLDPEGKDPTVTLAVVEQGIAQARRWQAQMKAMLRNQA